MEVTKRMERKKADVEQEHNHKKVMGAKVGCFRLFQPPFFVEVYLISYR